MPPQEPAQIGYKCKFRHTRWDATWGTCFPLYLGDAADPARKGWDHAWLDPARPNEMLAIVRTGAAENRHHWVVFGIYGGQGPQEGLYRAGDAGYPYPVLEFPFP
jgi:hypothetical protein